MVSFHTLPRLKDHFTSHGSRSNQGFLELVRQGVSPLEDAELELQDTVETELARSFRKIGRALRTAEKPAVRLPGPIPPPLAGPLPAWAKR